MTSKLVSIVRQNRDWPKQVIVYRVVDGERRGILFECCLNAFGHSPKCSECPRCSVKTTHGQCSNKACLDSELCVTHIKAYYHVIIKRSRIPNGGLGLFAVARSQKATKSRHSTPVFRPGDPIAPYGGIRMTPDEFDALYDFKFNRKRYENTGPYAVSTDHGEVIDGLCVRRVGAYANDFRGSDAEGSDAKGPNAILEEDQLVATKNIYPNDEIYVDYGEEYWEGAKNIDVEQRPIRPDPRVRQTGLKGAIVRH